MCPTYEQPPTPNAASGDEWVRPVKTKKKKKKDGHCPTIPVTPISDDPWSVTFKKKKMKGEGSSGSSGLGQNTAIRETLASMNVASEAAPCEVQRVTDATSGENGMQDGGKKPTDPLNGLPVVPPMFGNPISNSWPFSQ